MARQSTALAVSAEEVSLMDIGGLRTEGLSLLQTRDEDEVLEFLSARPTHTVIMAGLIRDNGLVSNFNRGTFYAFRNAEGFLEGIALIGHVTMFDVRTEAALQAFAFLASRSANRHLIVSEQHLSDQFWNRFARRGQLPRRTRCELLFEHHRPQGRTATQVDQFSNELRLARLEDLEELMQTHARMAVEELGLEDPLRADPDGFRSRYARRIEQGRVWAVIETGNLLFKADVVAETPEAVHLEGIYVNPDHRGQGCGSKYLTDVTRRLLNHTKIVCLFVDVENQPAQSFYLRAGFRRHGSYTTILV